MKLRKLIRYDVLGRLTFDVAQGVPLARAMRNHTVEGITRPTVSKLVKANQEFIEAVRQDNQPLADAILSSLDPAWLSANGSIVQETELKYEGEFPYGAWHEVN